MGLASEFRTFIQRGSVIDLAVGVIIGGAFGKIVTSLVEDVIMPPIGLAIGGIDFSALKIFLGGTPEAPVAIRYGNFLQSLVTFLIVAFCIFLIVKAVNSLHRETPAEAPPAPTPDQQLLAEIRDLLQERRPLG
jgi:large conductance mechanosensitive channel